MEGGFGADTVSGGTGIDTLSYAASAAGVTVNLATLTTSGWDAEGDVFGAGADFENILGSANANDTLTGSALANRLSGLSGNERCRVAAATMCSAAALGRTS